MAIETAPTLLERELELDVLRTRWPRRRHTAARSFSYLVLAGPLSYLFDVPAGFLRDRSISRCLGARRVADRPAAGTVWVVLQALTVSLLAVLQTVGLRSARL